MTGRHTPQSDDHPELLTRCLPHVIAATLRQVTKKKSTPRETLIGFGVLGAIAVFLCCGGITAIGALTDSGDKDSLRTAAESTRQPTTASAPTEARKPDFDEPCSVPGQITRASNGESVACNIKDDGTSRWGIPYEEYLDEPTPTARATPPKVTPRGTTAAPPKKAAPYYRNCDQAYDAGTAPLFEGEPGYRPGLDADGDGEACEGRHGNGDPGPDSDGDVYYKNCTAVRAAGADPIRKGQPGYGRHLDRDGDGVGCE